MANHFSFEKHFDKTLHEAFTRFTDLSQPEKQLPKTAIGLWKRLNQLGYFQSIWEGAATTWQPTQRQWKWFRWALHQQSCHMFLGARGIGKTEILTVFRIVYMVVQNPSISILLITGTMMRSKEVIRLVRSMLESLGLPLIGDALTMVRTKENYTSKHPTVYSASIGKKIKGDHPDLIIIEDPLDEKEGYSQAKKETVMKTINEARRMANEQVFLIGQFVAEDDPYAQFSKEGSISILTAWAWQCPELIRTKKEDFVIDGNPMLEYSWAINMEGYFPPRDGELFAKIPITDQYPTSKMIAVLDPAFNGRDSTALAIGGTYVNELGYEVLVAWVFSWREDWHATIRGVVEGCQLLGVQELWYEGRRYREIGDILGDFGIEAQGFESTVNKLYKIEHVAGYVGLGRIALHTTNSSLGIERIRRWHNGLPHDDEVDALAMLAYRLFGLDKSRMRRLWG